MQKSKTESSSLERRNNDNNNLNFKFNIKKENFLKYIINADDMGLCEERDEGIFELYSKGYISSASILVNGFNFKKSIEKAREINMPLGLHINLTEGFPINNNNNFEENTLLKKIGENSSIKYNFRTNQNVIFEITNQKFDSIEDYFEFQGKFKFREKLANKEINLMDVKNEIISQIEKFIKFYKSPPMHIDGHQHIHIIPEIAEMLSDIMSNYFGIYHVRIPAENELLFDKLKYEIPYTVERKAFHKKIISDSKICREIYLQNNIYSTQNFLGMTLMGKNFTEENFKIAKEIYDKQISRFLIYYN